MLFRRIGLEECWKAPILTLKTLTISKCNQLLFNGINRSVLEGLNLILKWFFYLKTQCQAQHAKKQYITLSPPTKIQTQEIWISRISLIFLFESSKVLLVFQISIYLNKFICQLFVINVH